MSRAASTAASAAPAAAPASADLGPLAADADLLANLDRQEALQEARQQATVFLRRFVGAAITRFLWGGLGGSLDGLGLEPPEAMAVNLTVPANLAGQAVQLELTPHQGQERYLARVVALGNVAHGVACRGGGPVGGFLFRGDRLLCPPGWQELSVQPARR
jgi:hypothetical protein